MNGPKPVCTSARKKMNQSRPRRLWREGGAGVGLSTGSDVRDEIFSSPIGRPPCSPSMRLIEGGERAKSMVRLLSAVELQRLQDARCAKYHDRLILFVFGRCCHLILGQFERDALTLVSDTPEMQCVPVYDDFSAADAEKAAKIDDGRAHQPGPIDDDIDDAAHALVRRAADVTAEHTVCFPCADDGDRGRWRRLLRRSRGHGSLRLRRWRGALIRRRHTRLVVRPGRDGCQSRKCDRNENERNSGAHAASRSARPEGASSSKADRPLRGPWFSARARSTPESGRASATPPVTLPRRGGEHRDRRWMARA